VAILNGQGAGPTSRARPRACRTTSPLPLPA
jgi:hypothetical protein